MKENNTVEKIEINYLKKLRRATIIKSIIIAILIVFIIFLGIYLYKLNIVNKMGKVYKEYQNSDYYIETITGIQNQEKDDVLYLKQWKKGNKIKQEYGEIKEDGTYEYQTITYSEIGSRKKIELRKGDNKLHIYNDYVEETNTVPFIQGYTNSQNLIGKLGRPFFFKVRKDTQQIGRWYYILETENDCEIWIDKETYEPIRSEGFVVNVEYFNNTKVMKKRNPEISQVVQLEKNNVKDEDVEINLEEYEIVQEKDLNIENLM